MPAGGLSTELFGVAIASLWLFELVYWLAFISSVRVLFSGLAQRRWFDVAGGLALAAVVWPWSVLAAKQLVWMLF